MEDVRGEREDEVRSERREARQERMQRAKCKMTARLALLCSSGVALSE